MKTKQVNSITSNEEYVRMRIFDGEFTPDNALEELLRIEKEQHSVTRKKLSEVYNSNFHLENMGFWERLKFLFKMY